MATRPGSGQCLLDCPEDGEPLATRRDSERRETEQTMDSLNLGERELAVLSVLFRNATTVCIQSRTRNFPSCPGCDILMQTWIISFLERSVYIM